MKMWEWPVSCVQTTIFWVFKVVKHGLIMFLFPPIITQGLCAIVINHSGIHLSKLILCVIIKGILSQMTNKENGKNIAVFHLVNLASVFRKGYLKITPHYMHGWLQAGMQICILNCSHLAVQGNARKTDFSVLVEWTCTDRSAHTLIILDFCKGGSCAHVLIFPPIIDQLNSGYWKLLLLTIGTPMFCSKGEK